MWFIFVTFIIIIITTLLLICKKIKRMKIIKIIHFNEKQQGIQLTVIHFIFVLF